MCDVFRSDRRPMTSGVHIVRVDRRPIPGLSSSRDRINQLYNYSYIRLLQARQMLTNTKIISLIIFYDEANNNKVKSSTKAVNMDVLHNIIIYNINMMMIYIIIYDNNNVCHRKLKNT